MMDELLIEQYPLIDTHVHRIHPARAPRLPYLCSFIAGKNQETNARNTVFYGQLVESLRTYLNMPGSASWADIEAERDRRYKEDPEGYFAHMVKDTNVLMYCLEVGSPLFAPAYTEEETACFHRSIPEKKCSQIVRIERLMDDMMPMKLPFAEFLDRFMHDFDEQVQNEKTVGIKTCAAYYGGLDIAFSTKGQAAAAYEKIREEKGTAEDIRNLYHYFLMLGTEFASKYDLPLQIHTGVGAGKFIDYRTMNPIYLADFLLDKRVFERVKVVLLHGGHPYEEDTGNLVLQFPNVYSDFSGVVWYSATDGCGRLRALLERAPLNKIMYGSDATMLPELYWYSPLRFRRLLRTVLNGFVTDKDMSCERACDAAKMIMFENALNCYSKIKLD